MTYALTCQIAFKEWAAVCEALGAGRQAIILRKGGIAEGHEGFRVQHRQFLLYPTNFHQAAESLSADAGPFIQQALANVQTAGTTPGSGALDGSLPKAVHLRLLAQVHEVHELSSEASALRLAGQHIWAEAAVRQRFVYKKPGLYLLAVRVYSLPQAIAVTESPPMAGCKSWVELPLPISTEGMQPVLSEQQFQDKLAAVRAALD